MDWDRDLDPPDKPERDERDNDMDRGDAEYHAEKDEKRPKVRLATITLLVDDSQLEDVPPCTNPKGLAHWLDKYVDVFAFEIDRATKGE